MNLVINIVEETWSMIAEMGVFLLMGFAISALLHRFLKQSWVESMMGRKGLSSVVWGSVVGVPMPLCSCGVIPVTMSLRDKGASKGATVSFLTSTPQTGIDSILASYAMLGPVFTAYKVVVAFLSGIVVGLMTSLFPDKTAGGKREAASPGSSHSQASPPKSHSMAESLRYAFVTMPGDLASALLLGFVLAGLISALAPADLLTGVPGGTLSLVLLTTLISVPFYICSTGSIPLALALIQSGLPMSAALVLLIAGPATNITTITTMRKVLGGRSTVLYVIGVVLTAWIAAAVFHFFIGNETVSNQIVHLHEETPLWKHIGGIALMAVLLYPSLSSLLQSRKGKDAGKSNSTSMNTINISISGMTCSHCENSVRTGLSEITGADRVLSVDRKTNTAVIEGDSIDESSVQAKIESLGYEFKGIEVR